MQKGPTGSSRRDIRPFGEKQQLWVYTFSDGTLIVNMSKPDHEQQVVIRE